MKKFIKAFLYGSIFGFGSPIPGVSAGTVAIFLNVYDDFFKQISVEYVKKNIGGVVSFLLGWAVGLFGIANFVMFLFENFERAVSFVFIGLILVCVPMIWKKVAEEKIRPRNVVLCVFALAAMIFLAFFGEDFVANTTLYEIGGATLINLAWIFFASFVSSMAMLIPGVGGSLMMLAFGIYTIYLEAVADLNILVLVVFGVSMVLGVVTGIFLTKKMLERFSQALYFVILGCVVGSIFVIFPGF